jgi:hypothetical protein
MSLVSINSLPINQVKPKWGRQPAIRKPRFVLSNITSEGFLSLVFSQLKTLL